MLALAALVAPPAAPARQAPTPTAEYVYVTNQGEATISLIDRDTHREVRRIDLQALGFSANARPHHVAIEPDGSFWYVTLIGDNRVVKFDRDGRPVGQVTFEVAGMLALDPASDLLYVGRSMSAVNPPTSIGVIRRSTMELLEEVDVVFPRPHALAVRPGGDAAYIASLGVNQLASIQDAEVAELLSLEGPTHTIVQFAISPDGRTLVGTGQLTGKLLVFDLADPLRPRLIRTVDVEAGPFIPAFSPDGRTLWVPNKDADAVTAVDTERWVVTAVIRGEGLAQPDGAAVSPDGRWVFVSNNNAEGGHHAEHAEAHGNGTVVVIDATERRIVEVIPVGRNATGIATRGGP